MIETDVRFKWRALIQVYNLFNAAIIIDQLAHFHSVRRAKSAFTSAVPFWKIKPRHHDSTHSTLQLMENDTHVSPLEWRSYNFTCLCDKHKVWIKIKHYRLVGRVAQSSDHFDRLCFNALGFSDQINLIIKFAATNRIAINWINCIYGDSLKRSILTASLHGEMKRI